MAGAARRTTCSLLAVLGLALLAGGCLWQVKGTSGLDCEARGCYWDAKGGCLCPEGKGGVPQGMYTKP